MKQLMSVRLGVLMVAALVVSSLSVVSPAGAMMTQSSSGFSPVSSTHKVAHTGADAPGAPTNLRVALSPTSAVVRWTAPSFVAGFPILGYTVTASPGGQDCAVVAPASTVTGTTTASCTVFGLAANTSVTFSVVATSAGGTGPAASLSGSVTPIMNTPLVSLSAWPASPQNVGTPVTFTTFLDVGSGGTVEFDIGGTAIKGCESQAVSSGYASCTTTALVAGSNPNIVTAVYSGDLDYASATSSVSYTISSSTLNPPSILTINSLSGPDNTSLTLTTLGGSGSGAITFSATNGTAAGCTVTGMKLSVTEPGTCLVTATQASAGSYLGQSSNVTTVTMFASYAAAWAVTGTYRDCAYGGSLPDCTSTSAATATTTYSCPSGGSLSGSTCVQSYAATATHTCPSGSSYNASWGECEVRPGMSQSQCTQSGYSWYASGSYCYYFLAATTTYTCPQGGSLSGTNCVLNYAATPSTTYSCPSGETLSGSSCITSYGWVTLDSYGWVCTLGGSLSTSTCVLSGASGPAEAPGPPTSVIANSSNGAASLKWIAPASVGSSSISSYTATAVDATNSSNGGQTCSTSTTRSCTVTGLTDGDSYTFTVVATNVVKSSVASEPSNFVVPGAAPSAPTGLTLGTASAYTSAMKALSSSSYWPMSDPVGSSTLSDASGNANTGIVNGSPTLGSPGPLATGEVAASFSGNSYVSTTTQDDNPQSMSMSVWFNSTSSGSIMGFSDTQNPTLTSNYDRGLWIDPTGHLVGGIYNTSAGATEEAVSSSVVNDGSWHFAVFTFGPSGEDLYVDGVLVGNNSAGTTAQVYNGWWSLGYQHTAYWPDNPSSDYFTGSLAGAGITPSVLTLSQVQSLYVTAQSGASLSWTASASNGSPVTLYTVTAHYVSGGVTPTSSVTACTTNGTTNCALSGLTPGDTYDFSVTATNAEATSSASTASGAYAVPSSPGVPTGLVASPTNLIADPTLASAPASWSYSYLTMGTANGDFNITSPGTPSAAWVYYGTGSSGTPYSGTQPITVVPGQTYKYSVFLDATHANSGTPGFMVFTTGYTWEDGLYQSAGSSGNLSGTWTAPAGVTQIFLSANLNGITVPAGQAITWSNFFFGPVGSTTLSWVEPNSNGLPVSHYTVTANYVSGGFAPTSNVTACTTVVTTCIPSGLTPGDTYDFTVTATNAVGTSSASAASTTVTAPGVAPDAPSAVTATASAAQSTISWAAPASNGGAAITCYTVSATDTTTSANGGETCTTTGALTCIVTGLTNGDSYTFTVTATNVVGTSVASTASNAVTPVAVPSAPTAVTAVGAGAISPVGSLAQAQGTAISSLSVSPQNVGDALVLSVGLFTTGVTVSSVSGGGATWQKLTNAGISSDEELWLGTVTATGPATITLSYSGSVASHGIDLDAQEYTNGSGPSTTWSPDVAGSSNNSSSSTAVAFPALTPSAASELYVGFGSLVNSGSAGSTSGFTYDTSGWGNLYIYDPSVSSAVSPAGAQSPAGTSETVGALISVSATSTATVSWAAPTSNGGAAITGYTVSATDATTSANGGETCTTTGALSCTVTGLTNGDSYSFTVTATNSAGTSVASTASNTVMTGTSANVPGAPTALVASPTNLIADPTLASAPSSWPQSSQATLGTSNGDFNITSPGTTSGAFVYYGNGNTGSYGFLGSQTITVVPGQTYNYSAYIDATAATAGNPGFFIYTPAYTWEGGLYQSPGTSGYMVGTWTAPAGVTQIFVMVNLDGSTITPGSTISWSNFFFAPTGTTSLSWTASSANGSPVTQYTVSANYVSGGVAPTTDVTACTTSGATSCSPSGLTAGDIYDFTVTATNANGTSAASVASGTVIDP